MSGKAIKDRPKEDATDSYLEAMVERYAANPVDMVNKIVI